MDIQLLRDIRDQVIGLLHNRYVFRTHQEIVRRNPRLQGNTNIIFSKWAEVVYVQANAVGVRRIASSTFQEGDVNLVRFFDSLIRSSDDLYPSFERNFTADVEKTRARLLEREGSLGGGWQSSVCKQLIGEDRKEAIRVAEKTNWFASKRVAHHAPNAAHDTTYSDLDEAIDALKKLTEKYSIVCSVDPVGPVAASPAIAPIIARMTKYNGDLLEEMKSYLLPGWDAIFLEPWATPETIALPLGEMPPPTLNRSRN